MVEHRSAVSKALRFDSSWGIMGNFFLCTTLVTRRKPSFSISLPSFKQTTFLILFTRHMVVRMPLCAFFSLGKLSLMELRDWSAINASNLIKYPDTSHLCTLSKNLRRIVVRVRAVWFRSLIIWILRPPWKAKIMKGLWNYWVNQALMISTAKNITNRK